MAKARTQRNTRQRQVILEELRKLGSHPSASELYEAVRRRLPRISLGTVYRNLELLARSGRIQKLEVAGSPSRFDGNLARHCHVRCVRCGRIDDVDEVRAGFRGGDPKGLNGYDVIGHRLEFTGICPACKLARAQDCDQGPGAEAGRT